jgi:hypothetical protein
MKPGIERKRSDEKSDGVHSEWRQIGSELSSRQSRKKGSVEDLL